MQETQLWSLSQEDPLKKEMAKHSSILAGKFHRQRSLAGYSPQGCKESDTKSNWAWNAIELSLSVILSVSHFRCVWLFCDPMDCSLLGSSVHRIPQARILEWVAIPYSRGSSWPRDWTRVSHTADRFFIVWATSAMLSCSVMSDSLRPQGLQPARLLCPREFSRQEYWNGLPCPPPGDLAIPGIELNCRWILYPLSHQGSPWATREAPKHINSMCTIEWFDVSIHCKMITTF